MYEFLQVSESFNRMIITLNRPPLNIFHIPMLEEFNNALSKVNSSRTNLLLLRAEGKCFSAGMDVADHLPDKFNQMLHLMGCVLDNLTSVEIPTVCALHGSALGGGLELAVFADLVYAESGTKLGQPEIKLGVFPPAAIAYFSELIGPQKTLELVYTGQTISAEKAKEIGLINDVFSSETFWQTIEEITKMIAGYSGATLRCIKKAFRQARGKNWSEALAYAEEIYRQKLMTTQDALEGLNAFLEKRPPQWKNQ